MVKEKDMGFSKKAKQMEKAFIFMMMLKRKFGNFPREMIQEYILFLMNVQLK